MTMLRSRGQLVAYAAAFPWVAVACACGALLACAPRACPEGHVPYDGLCIPIPDAGEPDAQTPDASAPDADTGMPPADAGPDATGPSASTSEDGAGL